ncbi:MAG: hypothetical protein GF390_02575 [Candidatus Pacebacteria bacterium]|nr:hypothetical protein [Candidatus Paceibacterota bacterium]
MPKKPPVSKPEPAMPKKSKLSPKMLGGLVVLLLVVVGGAVGLTLVQQQGVGETRQQASTEDTVNKTQTAKQILSCLDSMKNDKGAYLLGKTCDPNGRCQEVKANHSGPRPIWARFKYYQKTGDQNQLNLVKNDLAINTNPDIIPAIQNDFWNCKLMAELWQSNSFSNDDKSKIRNICLFSSIRPDLVALAKQDSNQLVIALDDLKYASFYPSELVGKYKITNNTSLLDQAEFFYSQAEMLLSNNGYQNYVKEACALGESALDLYQTTNKSQYLAAAEQIWQQANVSQLNYHLDAKAICGVFSQHLYQQTQKKNYQVSENIVSYLINNNFDTQGKNASLSNDYCFNFKQSKNRVVKSTTNASLILVLLLMD